MTAGIVVIAYGQPITAGSKVANHFGHGVRSSNATKLTPWRKIVTDAATDASRYHDTYTGPVFARLTFTIARPASHRRTGRNAHLLRDNAPTYPTARGGTGQDLDKLVRAVLDSLTDAKVWLDDSQVVDIRARKVFTGEHEQALDRPGVRAEIIPLDQEQ